MTLAAQNLGVMAKLLSRWKREQQHNQDAAFPGQGHHTPEQTELRQLRMDNQRLRMERGILKKRRPSSPPTAHEISLHSP